MDNLAALRSLMAAERDGSLSAAARRLGITQPAVSQHIAALEQFYGVELVVRGRNGVRLTEAGVLARGHAEEVIARIARMNDAMGALRTSDEGELTVACPLLIAQTVLVPVLADLRRLYPKLMVDLKATNQMQNLEIVAADLEIRACNIGPAEGYIRKLAEIEQVLIASPGYMQRVGHATGAADLQRMDYIQYKSDPDEKHLAFADGSLAPISVSFAAQVPDLMLHAVQNHLGIATLPRFFVQDHLDRGLLVEVLADQKIASKQLFLLRAPGTNAKGRRIAIFTERLMEQLAAVPGFRVAT